MTDLLYPNDPVRQRVHDRAVHSTLLALEGEHLIAYNSSLDGYLAVPGGEVLTEQLHRAIYNQVRHGG